jgi:hypothetical protein
MDIQACSNFFVQSFWEKVPSPNCAALNVPPSPSLACRRARGRFVVCCLERACILKRGSEECVQRQPQASATTSQ